jgi:hypothetical protein
MAHAQKPDLVFQRNGRVRLNRRGCQLSRLLAVEECACAGSGCVNTIAVDKYIVSYIITQETTELTVSTVVKCYMEKVMLKFLILLLNSRLTVLLASLSHVFIVGSTAG